jgi:cytochrome c oxidase assembly factor CtaG
MRTALGVAGAPGLTHALATGYHGPPELTVTRALTEWTLDPWMLVLIVLLGGGYLAGVRRVRARTPRDDKDHAAPWPVARPIWFCGLGLGFLIIATMSWAGVYQSVLLYPRAVQTVLLVLVVPLFLALGRPLTLFAAVFPRAGARLEAVIRCRPVRILTFPAITTFALVAVPFVMYFTSWYTAVFHSTTLRELTYLVLMVPGYVFFWTLLRVDPVPKEYSYAVSMWITGAEVIGDAFFGIAVIADQNLIGAGYFHALARPWGPTLATDQVIAGGVLWILGDLVGLPFLAAQLIHMMREDESDAARIDAELDARQAQDDLSDHNEPQEPQLWWETDPRFTTRFKPTS